MKRSTTRSFIAIFIIALSTACGNSSTNQNNADVPDSSPVVLPTATATNTPQPVVEDQSEELPPLTYERLLETGVETGRWTHGDGLVFFLRYFAGELSENDLPGVEQVGLQTGSGIVALADEYRIQPDADPEISAELERLLRKMFPPQDVLDAISQPADETGLAAPAKLASLYNPVQKLQSAEDCIDLFNDGYYDPDQIQGKICLYSQEREINSRTKIKVYYPFWTDSFSELESGRIDGLLDAMEKSALTYSELNGLTVKNFSMLYIPLEVLNLNIPISTRYHGDSDSCLLNIGTNQFIVEYEQSLNQMIALQMFNCITNWTFGYNVKFFAQGAPYYFSNVVFPDGDIEGIVLREFDQLSVNTDVFDAGMGPANYIFFQWLGNVYGPQKVVDFLHEFDSDSQKWLLYIASGSQGDFTRFVVEYLSQGIADENTGRYYKSPSPPKVTDTISIDEAREYGFDLEPFVASRYFVDYKKEKRFLQTGPNISLSAVEAKLHRDLSAWSGLPPEIRSSCKEDIRYLFVVTYPIIFEEVEVNRININVTEAEQAVCDPCLLGTWKINNGSFASYMESIFEKNVPQTSNFKTDIGGDYFMQFDSAGKVQAQRENLYLLIYLETEFNIQPTLDPTNPGPQPTQKLGVLPAATSLEINSNGIGNYSADGEFLTITQFVDIVEDVRTGSTFVESSQGFFFKLNGMQFEFGPEYAALDEPDQSETVSYSCDQDVLAFVMNDTLDLLWLDRVEKILPTPMPTPNTTPNPRGKP